MHTYNWSYTTGISKTSCRLFGFHSMVLINYLSSSLSGIQINSLEEWVHQSRVEIHANDHLSLIIILRRPLPFPYSIPHPRCHHVYLLVETRRIYLLWLNIYRGFSKFEVWNGIGGNFVVSYRRRRRRQNSQIGIVAFGVCVVCLWLTGF